MTPTWQICLFGGLVGIGAIDVLCRAARGLRSMWSRDWPNDVRVSVSVSMTHDEPVTGGNGSVGGDALFDINNRLVNLPLLSTTHSGVFAGFDHGDDLGSSQQELIVISVEPGTTEEDLRDAFLRAYESATTRLGFKNVKLWDQTEPTFRHLDVRQDA